MSRPGRLIAAVLATVALSAAAVHAEPGVSDSEIKVGLWAPLSGPAALLGQSARDGIRVWSEEINSKGGINGRKIRLIAYDDAGSPQEASAAVRRLIDQDQVFMLLSGSISGATLPVRKLITSSKVPFVSSISSNNNLMDPFSRYIFRVYANEDAQAAGIVGRMIKDGVKRPAIIYTSNDYGVGGAHVYSRLLKEKYNMTSVADERYNPGDQDFSAQLLRIKSANPDGLLVFAFAQEAGIIVRQAKELGLNVKFYGGGGAATSLLQRAAGPASIGFKAVSVLPQTAETSNDPDVVAYREKLKALYPNGFPPGRPSEYDLAAYTAGKIAESALRELGPNVTREEFVNRLERLKNFKGVGTFPVSYNNTRHEGTDDVEIIEVGPDLSWRAIGHESGK